MTHPHPKRRFVPQVILTKSGKLKTAGTPINTVRPVNTADSKPIVNYSRPISNAFKIGYSQAIRPFRYKAASNALEIFMNSSKMIKNQENVKSISDKGYHAVPLPYTGNYIPPKPDLMFIDEQVESDSLDVVSNVSSSAVKTVESKVESVDVKNKGVYSTIETKHVKKNNFIPPVIED
nr:hypothetical protein [Tanacetum cinerariifolium]